MVDAIPGARDEVFTESAGGYLWTTMRLTGPAQHPREDLKQRLITAAEHHLFKGILGSIFKPGEDVIELLQGIYKWVAIADAF